MAQQKILDFYARPSAMTFGGEYTAMLDKLPNDVGELTRIVQGLAIHEYAAGHYGVKIPDERRGESHIRPVERMLARLLAIDSQPLTITRPPDKRLVGVCHHFAMFLVAMLRNKGIPARYRCGVGSYFNAPYFEDHVVCEYWNSAEARWKLADPQFDEGWRRESKIDHDILDVPRDRFLIAGDAWTQCRRGEADPSKFGIFMGNLRGLWFIAGEIVRDVAGLNKMEMLPWDVWGAMPRPDEQLNPEQLAFFDRVASLTQTPDASFGELCTLYEDDRLRVPAIVFNAVLQREEKVL